MKIDSSNKPTATPSTPSAAGRARAGNTGGAASVSSQTSIGNASTEATLSGVQNVESVLASTPVVNAARVAEIKQAISEGRFQMNPERIADGLLQSVRDMLASNR